MQNDRPTDHEIWLAAITMHCASWTMKQDAPLEVCQCNEDPRLVLVKDGETFCVYDHVDWHPETMREGLTWRRLKATH